MYIEKGGRWYRLMDWNSLLCVQIHVTLRIWR